MKREKILKEVEKDFPYKGLMIEIVGLDDVELFNTLLSKYCICEWKKFTVEDYDLFSLLIHKGAKNILKRILDFNFFRSLLNSDFIEVGSHKNYYHILADSPIKDDAILVVIFFNLLKYYGVNYLFKEDNYGHIPIIMLKEKKKFVYAWFIEFIQNKINGEELEV